MSGLAIDACCKVNLTMEVLGKRRDGYHDIRSVMQFVDLSDRVELTQADKFSFWCDDESINNDSNLAVRAYRMLEEKYNITPAAVRLYKKVPYMSGLGGGSADCAAVLHGINIISGLGLSLDILMEMGSRLGADVPPCLMGGTLLAEGIGERVTAIAQAKPLNFCIIQPNEAFPTQTMYRKMDNEGRFAAESPQERFIEAVAAGDPYGVACGLNNSFEAVAEPADAIVQAKKLLMESGALGASMTGAGSAVFGIYGDSDSAYHGYERITAAGVKGYICRSAGSQIENK